MLPGKKNIIALLTCLFCFLVPAFATAASSSNSLFSTKDTFWWFHPVIAVSGGGVTGRVGHTQIQTLTMGDDFGQYQYTYNNARSTTSIWGIFLGTDIPFNSPLDLIVGVGYYQPGVFSSGNSVLTQGADEGSADQYIYSYKVKTQQLLGEGKLSWAIRKMFYPYVSLGLGASRNNSYDYTINLPPFLTFTPQFSNNTTTAFTYSVGLGIDFAVVKNLRLGIGYRFSDYGKTSLGQGMIDTTPFSATLQQSHFYSQEVFGQLTYIIF